MWKSAKPKRFPYSCKAATRVLCAHGIKQRACGSYQARVYPQQLGAVSAFGSQKHPPRFSQLSSPALPSLCGQSHPAIAEEHTLGRYFYEQLYCRLRAELCMAGAQQRTQGPVAQPGDTQRHSRSWQTQDSLRLFQLWECKIPGFPLFEVLPWRHQAGLLRGYLITVPS